MAKQTQGKRTASKAALKNAPAGRRRLKAKSKSAFPGGAARPSARSSAMVPRMTRS